MSEKLKSAFKELSDKEIDTLNHSLQIVSENAYSKEYEDVISENLNTLITSINILSRSRISVKPMRKKLEETLTLLFAIEKSRKYLDVNKLYLAQSVLMDYLEDIKLSGFDVNIAKPMKVNLSSEIVDLEVFGTRYDKNVFQLRAIRGSGSRREYAIYEILKNGIIKKIEQEFYTREKGIQWIERELGFRERLQELMSENTPLFRDESKEKNISIHRQCGRNDAEAFMLSQRKVDRQNEDITSLLTKSISEMISDHKLMSDAQLKAIIENKKSNEEITELTKELLSKTDDETDDLEKIFGNIATGIIVNKKKRDRFES